MSSTVFSLSVSAAETDNKEKYVQVSGHVSTGSITSYFEGLTVKPNNGTQESIESVKTPHETHEYIDMYSTYTISNADGSPLVYSGRNTSVKLSNVYYSFYLLIFQVRDKIITIKSLIGYMLK